MEKKFRKRQNALQFSTVVPLTIDSAVEHLIKTLLSLTSVCCTNTALKEHHQNRQVFKGEVHLKSPQTDFKDVIYILNTWLNFSYKEDLVLRRSSIVQLVVNDSIISLICMKKGQISLIPAS